MKFKLNEGRGLLKESPTAVVEKPRKSSESGQTALKEYIVDAVNTQLGLNLREEDYCVHHLFGEHYNNKASEVAITTHSNHGKISSCIKRCDWDTLESLLINDCYTLKVYAQKLISKDVKKIRKELEDRMRVIVDPSTGIKWKLFSYDIWHTATPIDKPKNSDATFTEFSSREELEKFAKQIESRK